MIKILWFSNCVFSDHKMNVSGTWMYSMAQNIAKCDKSKIYNVTQHNVDKVRYEEIGKISQWTLLIQKINKDGLPYKEILRFIKSIEKEVNPDLVHIWGTEKFWRMPGLHKILKTKSLFETQGLLSSIVDV